MDDHSIQTHDILSEYGIRNYEKISIINSGTANRSFLLEGTFGRYVIRERSKKYSDTEWIRYETEYLYHLHGKGIPVALPIKTLTANHYIRTSEKTYQIFHYIGGQQYDPKKKQNLIQSAVFLARLHNSVTDFMPSSKKDLQRYDDPKIILDTLIDFKRLHQAGLTKDSLDIIDLIIEDIKKTHASLPDEVYWGLPALVIHGDYHPANLKEVKGSICGIFDFDWISRQPRLRDIADGIIYFSSLRNDTLTGDDIFSLATGYIPDYERAILFLSTYNEYTDMKFVQDELIYLSGFIRSRLINSRIQALMKIPENRKIEMLTREIKGYLLWLVEYLDR